eukprot:9497085-Pyramimonas_sp.AAC.1
MCVCCASAPSLPRWKYGCENPTWYVQGVNGLQKKKKKGTPVGVVYRAQGWAAGETGSPRPECVYGR